VRLHGCCTTIRTWHAKARRAHASPPFVVAQTWLILHHVYLVLRMYDVDNDVGRSMDVQMFKLEVHIDSVDTSTCGTFRDICLVVISHGIIEFMGLWLKG
jgi:hypothetical protein